MIPHYFSLTDEEKLRFIAEQGAGTLVTARPDGAIDATFLPFVIGDQEILLHMARFNGHWKAIHSPQPAAIVMTGPHHYVSARDYLPDGAAGASTWDYTQVTIHGTITVHDDSTWVKTAALELAGQWDPEHGMDDSYVERSAKAIIGLSMTIERIDGQAKLSQNKLPEERAQIVSRLQGLPHARAHALAEDIAQTPSRARRTPYNG